MFKIRNWKKKEFYIFFSLLILLIIFGYSYMALSGRFTADKKEPAQSISTKSADNKPSITSTPSITATPAATPTLDRTWPVVIGYERASSLSVVVNKKHQLPEDYVPSDLVNISNGQQVRAAIADPFNQMVSDAAAAGLQMIAVSAYRSYQNQSATYYSYVNQYGQAEADTFSARPGFSEHQTGLSIDIGIYGGACNLETCLGESPLGKWIATNAPNYGFIIRYPLGKEAVTGYQYEPWHLRYLGVNTAMAITASGETMDEYFGILAGDYQ
jgi:D-alanyl-D-alanine carboxypeptidase